MNKIIPAGSGNSAQSLQDWLLSDKLMKLGLWLEIVKTPI